MPADRQRTQQQIDLYFSLAGATDMTAADPPWLVYQRKR